MESHPFVDPRRTKQRLVEPPDGVRAPHPARPGGREQVRAVRVVLPVLHQQLHCLLRDGHRAYRVLRLGPGLLHVQIRPQQGQQLAPAQAAGQFQIEHGQHPPFFRLLEIGPNLLWRDDLHLFLLQLGNAAVFAGIVVDETLVHRLLERLIQHHVDAPHHPVGQAQVLHALPALHPAALLWICSGVKGFSGWLHADGYQGYHKLPENIRVVGCWAHARRKFDEALQALPKEKRKDSLAAVGECYCTRLFQLEESFAKLIPGERYTKRLEQEKPVLDALLAWANETISKTAPKSALGKALHYLLEQWPYLVRYLEDSRLELSNNRAERSIKPFVMGRKNWLFANTPAGAQSSAVIYSLIETSKENKLDPYRYLLWVLRSAPVLSQSNESWAENLLPANASQECLVPQ